jgi:hypothetical protein
MSSPNFYAIVRFFVVQICYPLAEIIGRMRPQLRPMLELRCIHWNNACVEHVQISAQQILILLPHCLQFDGCGIRITHSLEHCKRCGRCVISELVTLEQSIGIPVRIATGGTIARRWVKETRPDLIIACACERDLSSGIYDSYPLPVFGILNSRPFGPCINTTVDVAAIRQAIHHFQKR